MPARITGHSPNLYRMSGARHDERFEQIGQSWLKHASRRERRCLRLWCTGGGSGLARCSDPYGASLNASQGAWCPARGSTRLPVHFPQRARSHRPSDSSAAPTHELCRMNDLTHTLIRAQRIMPKRNTSLRMSTPWGQTHPANATCIHNVSYGVQCQWHDEVHLCPGWITVRMTSSINAGPRDDQSDRAPSPSRDRASLPSR